MKTGRSLQDLAIEIERQAEAKKDFVAPAAKIVTKAYDNMPGISLMLDGAGIFGFTSHAHGQLAQFADIPKTYYDKMLAQDPKLLADNVNRWVQEQKTGRMVRTLDGNVRGLMSDRYRPLDNYELADAVFPVLKEAGATIASADITETKMYLKVLCPWLDRELPMPEGYVMGKGHNIFLRKIVGAVTISNSEIGAGALTIAPGIFEKQCTNLATFRDEGYGKLHVGKKQGTDDGIAKYLSDETRRIEDQAVWMKVRDVLKATMDGRVMDAICAKLVEARADAIEGDPVKVVEVFAKKNGLNETEKGGLLKHLVDSGEMTRYGLQWGVTRLAGEVESYDRASELERLGGEVIELGRHDWQVLAKAA